ncbi:MAG: hypothetical protein MSS24_01220 [Clostridiales bacterium]|nr:hypothetical protein [Clostridiales bacterium]
MWNKKNINQGVVESDEVEAESLDFSEEPLLHVSDEEIPGESPEIDEVNSSSHSVADNIPEELLPEDPAARERVIQVLNDPAAMRKIAAALEDLRKEYQLEYIFSKTGLAAISAARLSQDEKKLQLAVEAEAEIGSEFDISKLDEDDKDQDLSFSDEEREEAISFAKALGFLGREEGGESPGVAESSEHVEPSEGGPLSEPEGPSVPSESSEPEGPSVQSESSEPEAEQAHKASLKERIIHLHKKNLVLMIIIEVAVVAALAGGIWQIQQTREHQQWLEADAKKTASAVTAAKGPVLENGYNQLVVKADAEINNARVEDLRRRAAAMERIPEERSTDIENSETYRIVQSAYYFNGPHLSSGRGSVTGPNGRETYYNLNMSGVVNIMHSAGFSGTYWVRSDGVKMFGNYVMVAANYGVHPKGSIVKSSLGLAIVVDTGGFASSNPQQLDLATAW